MPRRALSSLGAIHCHSHPLTARGLNEAREENGKGVFNSSTSHLILKHFRVKIMLMLKQEIKNDRSGERGKKEKVHIGKHHQEMPG